MKLWKNSKYVSLGDCFLVDKNNEIYVNDAINNGASKIVSELNNKYSVDTIKVDNINDYIKKYYNFDSIKLIGITGTNGKTTTCFLIYQMLKLLNIKVSYIGTIGFYIDEKICDLDNTTPSIDVIYNLIQTACESGCEVVVMEISSHALKQNRVYGLLFNAIGVTNVTKDHLDYHKSMNDYVNSKRKITKLTTDEKICVLNKKDKYYKSFIKKNNKNIIIGKDIKIKKIISNLNNTTLYFKDKKYYKVDLSLIGKFNVYNYLMAYIIIKKLGFNIDLKSSYKLIEPPGRMDKINYKKSIIFIDYAHTPDAVKKVLKTVSKIKNKGIITVIGCGGKRDKTKRPLMGFIASKYSKHVIFTNDNPRQEDEKSIMKDIVKNAKNNYEIIYDRKEAIKKGIEMLKPNQVLMILGKGHETYQIIGNEKKYFSDKKTVLKIIDMLS